MIIPPSTRCRFSSVSRRSPGAMPLSDEELQRFIVAGFLQLPPSAAPPSVHAAISRSILSCGMQGRGSRVPYGLAMLDGDAAGNNLPLAAAELRAEALLQAPALRDALCALLGPSYRLHPHRRAHLRARGAHTTMWHVDAYKGTSWASGRLHAPHWLMVCYYPQETTARMGPTELLPGSQYYRGDSDRQHYSRGHIPDFSEQMGEWGCTPYAVTGAAGTIVVMHYDLWHRALESCSDTPRLMLKFVAWRTEPPVPRLPPPRWPLVDGEACDEPPRELLWLEQGEEDDDAPLAPSAAANRPTGGAPPLAAPHGGKNARRRAKKERGGDAPLPEAVAARLARALGEAAPRFGGDDKLSDRQGARAKDALFQAVMAEAKRCCAEGEMPTSLLPAVLRWLEPRCSTVVRTALTAERRARVLSSRIHIWRHVWLWLHGATEPQPIPSLPASSPLPPPSALAGGTEARRLHAAYALAAAGESGALLGVLTDAARSTSERRTAAYGLVASSTSHRGGEAGLVAQLMQLSGGRRAAAECSLRVDPRPRQEEREWTSAAAIREADGFDAEMLLAASDPAAEALFLATVVSARMAPCGHGRLLLALYDSTSSISIKLVVLEALGTHGAEPACASEAAALLARVLSDAHADGGARAVASRALSQLTARCLSDDCPALRAALCTSVEAVSGALAADRDRYVRAHAFEALATLAMLRPYRRSPPQGEERLEEQRTRDRLPESASQALASFVQTDELLEAQARAAVGPVEAHEAVRWLAAQRRCPLTTPESPF
ncbi:hypothetical protein AB1Y20_017660 [Prymnesium parvum]|uniref:Phytanoyl-CoA dioxygenase n=1 Tax=Prymnesium parvum TaxID=97485 RepID=A0AB34JPP4_PRYPA